MHTRPMAEIALKMSTLEIDISWKVLYLLVGLLSVVFFLGLSYLVFKFKELKQSALTKD